MRLDYTLPKPFERQTDCHSRCIDIANRIRGNGIEETDMIQVFRETVDRAEERVAEMIAMKLVAIATAQRGFEKKQPST